MRSRSSPVLLAAALACALATPAAAAPEGCRLINPAEVGKAVGVKTMALGPAVPPAGSPSCQWWDGNMQGVKVQLSVKSAQAYQVGKGALSPTPVSGLGDEAYQAPSALSYSVLSVRKGQYAFSVTVRGLKGGAAAVQAAEKAIATVAVGRM